MTPNNASSDRATELSWKAHPFRERFLAGTFVSLLIMFFGAAVYVSMGSLAWSLLAVVVLVLSLNHFFFPSRFAIDQKGITARYLFSRKHYQWSSIRRLLWDRRGAYLSTRGRRSWLDAYRGLTILFGSNRSDIIKLIHLYMDEADGQ